MQLDDRARILDAAKELERKADDIKRVAETLYFVGRTAIKIATPRLATLEEAKLAHVAYVYSALGNNKYATARVLGVAVKTVYNLLKAAAKQNFTADAVAKLPRVL